MNEPETKSPTLVELTDEIVALRHQVFTLLLALIVVSGTLTVYLYRQARLTGKDIEALRPQAMPVIQVFNQSRQKMDIFINQLAAFGSTHPDFQQQVLRKYNIVLPPPATTSPPAATPAPKVKK
jgi:hypothetical protein